MFAVLRQQMHAYFVIVVLKKTKSKKFTASVSVA